MIQLQNLSKHFPLPNGAQKCVAQDINVTFPTGVSVGLLGRNGSGKTTLMEMIGGTMKPDAGQVITSGTVSFPVGFAGSFHRDMTGAQNARFVARIYGVDTEKLLQFVLDFSELEDQFYIPVRNYSAGMKSRLAFGISIGIPFDTYLVDEVTSVGDAAFKQKSRIVFQERMKTAGAVVVTHSMQQIRKLCQAGAVLENGQLTYYDDVEDAIAHHQGNMGSTEDE